MSIVGPFPTAQVVARLQATNAFKLVGAAAHLDAALDTQPAVFPAAYVLVNERSSEPRGYSGGVMSQKTQPIIQVILFAQNYTSGTPGSAALKDMDALVTVTRAALLNWSPSPAFTKLHHIAGRSERFKSSFLLWQEMFRCQYTMEQSAS